MKRGWSLGFVSLLMLGAHAGCSSTTEEASEPSVGLSPTSPWPKFRGDAAQTGRAHVPAKLGVGTPWEVKTGKGIFSSAVIGGDGTIYIGSADRTFYALNKDGTIKWKVATGEVVDSAALLDDKGRVYFGSGDGKLRALDAQTGKEVWTMEADDPSVNKAFIRWFEGNVAIGPGGTLYVPNDNFFLYAVNRDDGSVKWRYRMPDQTWSLPAVDAKSGNLYVGNNNLLPILGKNTFALSSGGDTLWNASTLGTVAASPMISNGRVFMGSFDGYVRAYRQDDGELLWETPTRDHVYASVSLLPDGTVVQPGNDGTVYGLDPATGATRWTFDAGEPIRSSISVDTEGRMYFGGGDGRLYVLDPDGKLRWSMKLVDQDRNDLNSSPALGEDAIVIAGESGQIFSVPYEWCNLGGKDDPRCAPAPDLALPRDGAELRYLTPMGTLRAQVPDEISANEMLSFQLVVREGGRTKLATLDASSLAVEVEPKAEVTATIAGDGKFVVVTPKTTFPPEAKVTIRGKYLVDHERKGLRLTGGRVGGDVTAAATVKTKKGPEAAVAFPAGAGARGTVWELSRLALPMPTLMPSYNQIGFDSLHYLVTALEGGGGKGVAFMLGAKLEEAQNRTVVDPTTRLLVPLEMSWDGDVMTLASDQIMQVEAMSAVVNFKTFRVAARLGSDLSAVGGANVTGSTVCAEVPFYGLFLQQLGLCNPQTDELVVLGGSELRPYDAARVITSGQRPATEGEDARTLAGTVEISRGADGLTAALPASTLKASEHLVSVILVDATTGKPIVLDYGLDTQRTTSAEGFVTKVDVPFKGRAVPAKLRAHVIVDTQLIASHTLGGDK